MKRNQEYYGICYFRQPDGCPGRSGIVLLVTLVLLVVISTLAYMLSNRISMHRHRNQYIIDYQSARYGCDSAAKYALATLESLTPELISRPNEPDFSDVFALDELEYKQLLSEWSDQDSEEQEDDSDKFEDINDINNISTADGITDSNMAEELKIRGPYGPAWPFVTEPVEFEVGTATIKVEIEDENAKYPIGWAMLDDKEVKREATAAFETFCEWMDISPAEIDDLKRQLQEIGELKPFKLQFKDISIVEKQPAQSRTSRNRRSRSRTVRSRVKKTTIPASVHTADFAKLLHSSMLDTETLARGTVVADDRSESALKYMSLWGSSKVNINTAPRNVLETAFVFGGDAEDIAEEIILRRKVKPFTDIEELQKELFRYSDSIKKCEKCIITTSTFFTIRLTAISGVARASTVIAVKKTGKKLKTIAVISG